MAPRMRIHNVKCDECDWEHTYTTYQRSIVAITAQRKWRHPRDTRGIEHVLGNAASLRLAVEAAKARGRMYLAAPELDPTGGNCYAVVHEIVELLADAPAAEFGGTHGPKYHEGVA